MLATLVIGLREGLEAVLIVSIIAAFLKRNGVSRRPMWGGVIAAVLISIGVGVALQAFEQALPQAQQEAMETIIGLVAVVFVTGMVVWMGKNARGLKAELEESASKAASRGTGWALAAMAFLAVLKEGFETAVFLLATLQASTSAWAAALGAVIGIVVSCIAGYLLYAGGTRMNLSRFFRISSVFLVFVAAGLLLTALRKAHGAGWVNIGQQHTVDLSWLSPIGSIQSALFTGVLGIPADPRVIEVLAWFCYLVPVLVIAVWPRRWKPNARQVPLLKVSIAAAAALAAILLPLLIPSGDSPVPATAAIAGAQTGDGTASATMQGGRAALAVRGVGTPRTITFPANTREETDHAGAAAAQWTAQTPATAAAHPSTLTLSDLTALFGRVPVGISTMQNPGPYRASWSTTRIDMLWLSNGGILDAQELDRTVLTLSGGGLDASRSLTMDQAIWAVPAATVAATGAAVAAGAVAAQELVLWRLWLPLVLAVAAVGLVASAWRDHHRLRRSTSHPASNRPRSPFSHPALSGDASSEENLRSTADAIR